ncbi:MAG: diguanylate cyclase [Syntrophales bacterium]|nr:diguanylate cyclase [Syntrophales bacterium]MDP3098806.1 diguanylate cyclase [Syntrophales bacterium]
MAALHETGLELTAELNLNALLESIADLSVPICPANGDSPPVKIHITISIGVAIALPGIRTLADLLERADHAMYRGKYFGRNRVVVWEETPDS